MERKDMTSPSQPKDPDNLGDVIRGLVLDALDRVIGYDEAIERLTDLLHQQVIEGRIDQTEILRKALSPHKGALAILDNELRNLKQKGI